VGQGGYASQKPGDAPVGNGNASANPVYLIDLWYDFALPYSQPSHQDKGRPKRGFAI
jgi:hypothetical protein